MLPVVQFSFAIVLSRDFPYVTLVLVLLDYIKLLFFNKP